MCLSCRKERQTWGRVVSLLSHWAVSFVRHTAAPSTLSTHTYTDPLTPDLYNTAGTLYRISTGFELFLDCEVFKNSIPFHVKFDVLEMKKTGTNWCRIQGLCFHGMHSFHLVWENVSLISLGLRKTISIAAFHVWFGIEWQSPLFCGTKKVTPVWLLYGCKTLLKMSSELVHLTFPHSYCWHEMTTPVASLVTIIQCVVDSSVKTAWQRKCHDKEHYVT